MLDEGPDHTGVAVNSAVKYTINTFICKHIQSTKIKYDLACFVEATMRCCNLARLAGVKKSNGNAVQHRCVMSSNNNNLTLRTSEASIPALRKLPCGIGRRYTGFAQTSLWRRKPVYRRYGMSTPGIESRYTGFVF